MISSSLHSWKQAKEGIRRGNIEILKQTNEFILSMSVQGYRSGNEVQMCMITESNNSKTFLLTQAIIDATSHIYIPTEDDLEEWEELGLDITQEIANRE